MSSNNILITGVKGFICSNLSCFLVNKYFDKFNFIGIDCESYCSQDKNIKEIIDLANFTYAKLDISDRKQVTEIFDKYNFQMVFHLAAFSHVDRSFSNPDEFFVNNVIGTYNLIEEARKHNVSKFIHMSTDEVYGDKYDVADENTTLNPTNPYSGTKACGDQLILSYINGFKFPAIIIRCNNIYGIKQYPEKVIPNFIMNMLYGRKCKIHGDGQQRRSFLHIDDFCNAFDIIINKGKVFEIYNISSSDTVSINELFYIIKESVEKVSRMKVCQSNPLHIENRQYNDSHYTINSSKISELGWKPQIRLNDSIGELVKHYLRN